MMNRYGWDVDADRRARGIKHWLWLHGRWDIFYVTEVDKYRFCTISEQLTYWFKQGLAKYEMRGAAHELQRRLSNKQSEPQK